MNTEIVHGWKINLAEIVVESPPPLSSSIIFVRDPFTETKFNLAVSRKRISGVSESVSENKDTGLAVIRLHQGNYE